MVLAARTVPKAKGMDTTLMQVSDGKDSKP